MSVKMLAMAHDVLGRIEAEKQRFFESKNNIATEIFLSEKLSDLLNEYCARKFSTYQTEEIKNKYLLGLKVHITKDEGYMFWLGEDKSSGEAKIL